MLSAKIRRSAAWGGVVATLTGAWVLGGAGTANAAGFHTANVQVNVRTGPSTSHRIIQVLPARSVVNIVCQTEGERVTGTYGTSAIWDKLSNNGFVSDTNVNTGSDGYIPGSPRCSGSPS
ncbi:SH3 domain-containing protein [Streptomyces sp. Qhu-G9]|uniref:SH3 domain-containing protein n=1 Tax=Streptomyces sp. Qhu-G9 TaxID=3452799 RepID=UPI0022AC2D16|nr:SH3 domain-containing protein [Streptomyces aurantiacus]WAU82971.1 SH3 domain-containing protein [Streptomyces aurantiacus]